MAIKIGHASIDERGKIAGGAAGDQTKKELCTRDWYNKGWNVMLRPKSSKVAEKSAKACEAGCANNNIGYDQNQRNTLNTQAKKVKYDLADIKTKCETDCSAFMSVCAIAGGADIKYGSNGPTTRTMRSKFKASGDYEVFTSSKYLTSDKYLERGDILIKEGSHTVMALEDGSKVKAETQDKGTSPTSAYYAKYTGKSSSIDTVLQAIGVSASYRGSYLKRKPLAKANGISAYIGSTSQNKKLVDLAKKGRLKKITSTGSTSIKKSVSSKDSLTYYAKYTGKSTSIDTVLKAIGVPACYRGSWKKRKPIAKENGISNYKGTSSQNKKLVDLAKKGKLKKA